MSPALDSTARDWTDARHPLWNWLLLACALATALPLWTAGHLPFTDLPQHVAAISTLRHWWDPAWHVRETFTLALAQTQYLLYYLAGAALAFPLGTAERANLVLLSATAIAFPYSLRSLLRALGADERLALFGCTLFWTQALLIGFFNYVAAMPLLLWGLALAVRRAERPDPKSDLLLGVVSLAIFYMHLSAFLFFAPAAALAVLLIPERSADAAAPPSAAPRWRALFTNLHPRRLAFFAPTAVATLFFLVRSPVVHPGSVGWVQSMTPVFESPESALHNLPDALLNIWKGPQDEWCLLALLAAVALLAWPRAAAVATPGTSLRRGLVAAWLALAGGLYFAFPISIGWMWQLNERYALVFALLLPALLRPAPGLRGALPLLCVAATALFAAGNATAQFRLFEAEVGNFDKVIDTAEPGKHLLSMIIETQSGVARFAPFLHYGSYYRARKGGVASFSFAELPQSPLRYQLNAAPPPKPPHWEWEPWSFRNDREGNYYDYILMHGGPDLIPRLNPGPAWRLKTRDGRWSLYEKLPGSTPSPPRAPAH